MKKNAISLDDLLIDKLAGGEVTLEGITDHIMERAFADVSSFCNIPDGYHHCLLEHTQLDIDGLNKEDLQDLITSPPGKIINPEDIHLKTIEFFKMILSGDSLVCNNKDPLSPSIGAYLLGPPGTGKTHIMAAFGLAAKSLLDGELEDLKRLAMQSATIAKNKYAKDSEKWGRDAVPGQSRYILADSIGGEISSEMNPRDQLIEDLRDIIKRLRKDPRRPSNLLYLGFQELCKLYTKGADEVAQKAIEQANILFVDDIHPKIGDDSLAVLSQLIEHRYELGRFGTFVTTNISHGEIGGDEKMFQKRLSSRVSESFVTLDFTECKDWRSKIKAKRVTQIEEELELRVSRLKQSE